MNVIYAVEADVEKGYVDAKDKEQPETTESDVDLCIVPVQTDVSARKFRERQDGCCGSELVRLSITQVVVD